MDLQPSLDYNPAEMSLLNYGGFLLPTDEYITIFTNFPGTHCNWNWGTRGHFFLTFILYQEGEKIGQFHTHCRNEKGYFNLNLDEITSFFPQRLDGYLHVQFYHPKTIPPELYVSHVHRSTGAYVAYPPLPFMGDRIHDPSNHTNELENALFWPGLLNNDAVQTSIVIVNPYEVSFFYQISLYCKDFKRVQTKALKVKPFQRMVHAVEELFPEQRDEMAHSQGEFSLCVAAQYKLVTYMRMKNRATGVFTAIDHLHRFCMV